MHEDRTLDFDEFFADTYPSLCRLAFARTGSWAAAEDLAQDAMADAQRRWDVVGRYDRPAAWARRAVLNRSVSRWRRLGRERHALLRLSARADVTLSGEPGLADDELWVAIRSLSARQMEVVLLLWFEELSVAETAETLRCGQETVRTHWRRARERLATALGEDDDLGLVP